MNIPQMNIPQITGFDLQARTLPTCDTRPAPPLTEQDKATIARMDVMTASITPSTTMPLLPHGIAVGDDRMWAYIYRGREDMTLVFVSLTRAESSREFVVNGRTVYDIVSHSRRVYVDAEGRAYPEIDGRIRPYVKKYTQAAALVLAEIVRKGGH